MIIDNNRELDRLLECTNLDKYELIDLPIEQHADSSQEHTGVRMAPTLDTKRTSGLVPHEGSLSSSNGYYIIVLDYKNSSPEEQLARAGG